MSAFKLPRLKGALVVKGKEELQGFGAKFTCFDGLYKGLVGGNLLATEVSGGQINGQFQQGLWIAPKWIVGPAQLLEFGQLTQKKRKIFDLIVCKVKVFQLLQLG